MRDLEYETVTAVRPYAAFVGMALNAALDTIANIHGRVDLRSLGFRIVWVHVAIILGTLWPYPGTGIFGVLILKENCFC